MNRLTKERENKIRKWLINDLRPNYGDAFVEDLLAEIDALRKALEDLNFWRCIACEENIAIRDKALGWDNE